ncbi:glycosyltransferase family 4 protein [Lacticaseibacillus paracasei]|uniref:glycosyltransferase family 4 protein n=1 Tax=Lacticaseibacillus paracasei TaxID=1597 RepID=UPI0031DFA0F9
MPKKYGIHRKSILVIDQYYFPEPFRVTAICESLANKGYEVQVVTGTPNYPEGHFYSGYGHGQRVDETRNGVRIHRCPILPSKQGAVNRVLNYYSFVIQATRFVRSKECVTSSGKPFDVVYVNQTSPVMMGEPAIAYKKKYNVPIVLYCLDLWPDSLVAGGIRRKSFIYKYYAQVSKTIYQKMDIIVLASRLQFCHLQNNMQIQQDRIRYIPQYAEDIFSEVSNNVKKPRPDHINLVFAGNVGKAQSLDTIINAAARLKSEPVSFHIVGSGSELDRVHQLTRQRQVNNVIFHGRKPLSDMPDFYAMADAMLVTLQADDLLSLTLPGKVQSYMAAGKTIIGAVDGEAQRVIQESKSGYCGPAEDDETLATNILKFIHTQDKQKFGENARTYYERNFSEKKFFAELEKIFDTVNL